MRELERDQPAHAGPAAGVVPLPPLALVGRGRLGGALARTAAGAGLDVTLLGRGETAPAEAEAVLLCVPDESIGEACGALASAPRRPRLVGHTSGATGLDAIAAAEDWGAELFGLHPLQTVPGPDSELAGAPCAIAGSTPGALGYARTLAEVLGLRPFEVREEARSAYHAAASIASNFLVALEESAAELLGRAGIEDARELLVPLVLRSAANWAEAGPDALTGPIARGDAETVERHLDALRDGAPELIPLYEALAERTRTLAERR